MIINMGRTAASYKKLLDALLPIGKAWSKDSGSMPELLDAVSQELSRIDGQIESLVSERDSRYTSALLTEHEADLDITPGTSDTDAERRIAIAAILLAMGGQDPQYFIDLAESMGYEITVDEYRPAWCGVVTCGESCGDQEVIFVWRVNLQYSRDYEDPSGADLGVVLERLKPAHTMLIYSIASPGFSRGFSSGFDAMPALSGVELEVGGFRWKGFTNGFNMKYGGGFKYGSFTRGFNNLK